ncbi:MAG: hypothetical protein EBZ50_13005, partial [Alphaproteobacteria bacterium]|nr:hypothetical protein [Alphaproteobacteria bacterium]
MIERLAARVRRNPILGFLAMAVAIVALASAAAFVLVDKRFERILDARDARAADLELRLLAEIDREEGRAALVRALHRRIDAFGENVEVYALADRSGAALAG